MQGKPPSHVRAVEGDVAKGPHGRVPEAEAVHEGEHTPLLQQRIANADLVVRAAAVLTAVA